jgi:N-acetylglucosaminyldiphosphoundecaprenol N-acetyl-beta-D-mannosaminyltransferase
MMSQRISICGVQIDKLSFNETVDAIVEHASSNLNIPRYVVTPNVQHIVLLQKDSYLRKVYRHAFLVVPDGVPLLWAASFLGTPLRGRVNGTDLFVRLCEMAAKLRLRVFFLGGRPGAAEGAGRVLKSRYSDLEIAGICCPHYGFEKDPVEIRRINAEIRTAAPHILFVALGTPKQEYWLYTNNHLINVPISIGIGASLDFVSGTVKRSPRWMQRLGLEWAFRLMVEPHRLWRRYIFGNPFFLWLVLRQRLGMVSLNHKS